MCSFRNIIVTISLCTLATGCGYTIPDYIDEQRFKNTPQFITIAKEQGYQPISIHSISEFAINQNYIAYLCEAGQKLKVCIFTQDQSNRQRLIKKIDTPIEKEHESYLLLNEFDHLFILSKDLTQTNDDEMKARPITALEIDLNRAVVKKIDIVDGTQFKNELTESLIQENKYRKKNDDEIGPNGVIYEEVNTTDVAQSDNDVDENELSLLSIIEMIYQIAKNLIQALVQSIASLFQDLSDTLIYKFAYTISDQTLTFAELPSSFPQYYHDKVLSQADKVNCLQPFSSHQMDYLIQYQDHSQIWINTPMIDTLVEDQTINRCDNPHLQEVTQEKIIHEVVTGNRYSGNHYVGGYSAEGFNIFNINNIQFQAPFNTLSIYQYNRHTLIEFPESSFYLVPTPTH